MNDIIKVNLDETTVRNLKIMIPAWLTETDLECDMNQYSNGDKYDKDAEKVCGTVTCGLGLCPLYIILQDSDYHVEHKTASLDYDKYGSRVFPSLYSTTATIPHENSNWVWLFSTDWKDIDNTYKGVAQRAQYLLDNEGIPMNWQSQLIGNSPYIFGER